MNRGRYYWFLAKYINLLVFKRNTLGRTMEAMARARGADDFLLFEGERTSFDTFNRRANRRANLFKAVGVARGEVACLLMENRPEYLETVVGLAKLGAVTALINAQAKDSPLVHSLNTSGAHRLIVGAECLPALREVLPQLERIRPTEVFVDTRWPDDGPRPEGMNDLNKMLDHSSDGNPPRKKLTSRDPVLYIYTSGTTGLPKAARINHYRWYGAGLGFGYYAQEVGPEDTVFCPLPLYHSNGILIAFASALVNGARFAITRQFSARRFWDEVRQYRATTFIYIGEVLRYLFTQPSVPGEREHSLRRILGNGLRPDIWSAFQERFAIPHIREFYSSTEGNTYLINLNDKPGSVGTVVLKTSDNTALVAYDVEKERYLRDDKSFCRPCAPDEVGELLGRITFTTPFHGYANAKDTESKLLRDVFRKGDVYFRTGDLMTRDAEGNFYFVDRIGDTFRWKGENVSTQEVQEVLSGFGGVQMVNVYGVQVPGAEGRVGMAAILLDAGAGLDGAALFRHLDDRLSRFAMPAFVRLVTTMDMTGTFKLRKLDLQRDGFDPGRVRDPLYYQDRRKETYLPLDQAEFQRIQSGQELRF